MVQGFLALKGRTGFALLEVEEVPRGVFHLEGEGSSRPRASSPSSGEQKGAPGSSCPRSWPYSKQQRLLQQRGVAPAKRPSGHEITERFCQNNGGAIPPNLIALAHTESNSAYLRYCRQRGLKPHPARFPVGLPAFFIRFLTDPGDLVLDPFAGSLTTGEAAEALGRRWVCVEKEAEYVLGASDGSSSPQEGGKGPPTRFTDPPPWGSRLGAPCGFSCSERNASEAWRRGG